jgi:large subunit ribosomal protein L9
VDVILLEKIRNLGNLGDKVTVAGGYGRNYLIPKGKALPATKINLAEFESKRAELEKLSVEKLAQAHLRQEKLSALSVLITARTADDKLYGSLGPKEIAEAVSKLGVDLCKSEVRMPLGQIRVVGEHSVGIQLHSDVAFNITVKVVSED